MKSKLFLWFGIPVLTLVLIGSAAVTFLLSSFGRTLIAEQIERLASSENNLLDIGNISGSIFSTFHIDTITLHDSNGKWLEIGQVSVSWSPIYLLTNRELRLNSTDIGFVAINRLPDINGSSADTTTFSVPAVLLLSEFSIAEISVSEEIIGTDTAFAVNGRALVPFNEQDIEIEFFASRLDRSGDSLNFGFEFNPVNEKLTVTANVTEDANGVISSLLNLQGTPSLNLSVHGDGFVSEWLGSIEFSANEVPVARGTIKTGYVDNAVELYAAIKGNVDDIAPPEFVDLLSGEIELKLKTRTRDEGTTAIEQLTLITDSIDLDASGLITSDGIPTKLSARLFAIAPSGGGIHVKGLDDFSFSTAKLNIDFHEKEGAFPWKLSGNFSEPSWLNSGFEAVQLNATGSFIPLVEGEISRVTFNSEAELETPKFENVEVEQLLGSSLRLTANGNFLSNGTVNLDAASLTNWLGKFDFSLGYGGGILRASAISETIALMNMAKFTGLELDGEASISANVLVKYPDNQFTLEFDSQVNNSSLGIEQIDGLIGGLANLDGEISGNLDLSNLEISSIRFNSPELDLTAQGTADSESISLELNSTISNVGVFNPELSGTVKLAGTVEGMYDSPSIKLAMKCDEMTFVQHQFNDLAGELNLIANPNNPSGSLNLTGEHLGLPVSVATSLSGFQDNKYVFDEVRFNGFGLIAKGQARLHENGIVEGKLSLDSSDLSSLGHLFQIELGGTLQGSLNFEEVGGQQHIDLVGNASDVATLNMLAEDFFIEGLIVDPFGSPKLVAEVLANEIMVEEFKIDSLKGSVQPSEENVDFSILVRALGFVLDLDGNIIPTSDMVLIELEQLILSGESQDFTLVEPVSISYRDTVLEFDIATLGTANGEVRLWGNSSETINLVAENIPLAIFRPLTSELELDGELSGSVEMDMTTSKPRIVWTAKSVNSTANLSRQFGLGQFEIDGNGEIVDNEVRFDVRLSNDLDVQLNGVGYIDLNTLNLNVNLDGQFPMEIAEDFEAIASRGIGLSGKLNLELKITGNATSPQMDGKLTVTGGTIDNVAEGIRVTELDVKAEFSGNELKIQALTGKLNDLGTIQVTGTLGLDPAESFPASLMVKLTDVHIVQEQLLTMTFDADIGIDGPIATSPLVVGRVDISHMDIRIPDRLPIGYSNIEIEHVSAPDRIIAQMRSIDGEDRSQGVEINPFNASLNVDIFAPEDGFLVRGRGLLAEMGGQINLEGSSNKLEVSGDFTMIKGRLSILGKNLVFERGVVTFTGNLNPDLNFLSSTEVPDAKVFVGVTGVASDPVFSFSSEPDLPQEEVLALLLFNRQLDQLSSFQIVTMATQVASLTSNLPVGLGSVGSSLGVDVLDVTTDVQGNAAVEVGKYINENVYLGVISAGETSSVSVDIDLTNTLKGRGELDKQGDSKLGIEFTYDY